ncbi:nucleophile aminohydrolase [Yarrowia lipolytica]|jgi:taspase (threonine aspartase 1)|uniref:YALI0F30723p n=2 Tax=Yarrowia lipolytica TaxID=4952 RepID=Q6BZU9_YARLI|nr:YALI0F30723p [Yarrowia lipolytica CLIB122]AOW07923.1 hypothetical protein YALI1_F38344g [Yarrowia lipolytica]AYO51049.1 L-asparaginase [Yarrowia lipolytica]AZG02894.1 L-asparaginase [Yarrowia lipolytica]AZG02895.1 L-asparaginase [Yarrowia lipolytica]AZG02896.1 L-asparaginase [Yarrowia lipolytica]|eukprot:XP_506063.1 YALI0F30723p [Yarrowia lipolytica CLIB122]
MVYVALHLGAGTHSHENYVRYKRLAKKACELAISEVKAGKSVGEAAVSACRVLEDSPLVNAGYGSQLDIDGDVACDAGYIDTDFVRPACVSGITRSHPISTAKALSQSYKAPSLPLERHRPVHIHGQENVESYLGIEGDVDLKSPEATRVWEKWKRLEQNAQVPSSVPEDTVGVIVGDKEHMAIATSSGGPILKSKGRVGPVATYGCGFSLQKGSRTIGVCTTGCGEDIITSRLSGRVLEALAEAQEPDTGISALFDKLQGSFQSSPVTLGCLAVVYEEGHVSIYSLHKAPSMISAVKSGHDKTNIQWLQKDPNTVVSSIQIYRER